MQKSRTLSEKHETWHMQNNYFIIEHGYFWQSWLFVDTRPNQQRPLVATPNEQIFIVYTTRSGGGTITYAVQLILFY